MPQQPASEFTHTVETQPQVNSPKNSASDELASFDDFNDLLVDDEPQKVSPQTTSYAQTSAFVKAPIEVAAPKEALSKEAFIEAWQETAGKAEPDLDIEEDFDLDAPLTDAFGRPMSRAMQVAQKRRDLPTLPGLELLDEVDPNKKVNFTAEQLARLSELLEIKLISLILTLSLILNFF